MKDVAVSKAALHQHPNSKNRSITRRRYLLLRIAERAREQYDSEYDLFARQGLKAYGEKRMSPPARKSGSDDQIFRQELGLQMQVRSAFKRLHDCALRKVMMSLGKLEVRAVRVAPRRGGLSMLLLPEC